MTAEYERPRSLKRRSCWNVSDKIKAPSVVNTHDREPLTVGRFFHKLAVAKYKFGAAVVRVLAAVFLLFRPWLDSSAIRPEPR